ncbi:MAG: histidine phosphatase family protein [Candidatus Thorarchaeota archaeon]
MDSTDRWTDLEWLVDARSLIEWTTQLGNIPTILLVRHSERLVNLSPSDTLKAELTPTGHEMAIAFGRNLPQGKKITLLHSPNIRTKQTAERIAEGILDTGGSSPHISSSDILWGPESDYSKFASLLNEHGFPEVYRRWINGNISPDVFEPMDQFIKRLIPYSIDRLELAKPDSIEVLVTHDLVIDIAQRKFLGINTGADNFDIPFLGGLGFSKSDGIIQGYHKGQNYPLIFKYF